MSTGTTVAFAAVIVTLCVNAGFGIVRWADYYAAAAGMFALPAAGQFAAGNVADSIVGVGMAAWYVWLWWKHRHDDDNRRGKRLKAWVRSKLPKPATRTVRNPV